MPSPVSLPVRSGRRHSSLAFIQALRHVPPARPWRTVIRSTGDRLRPPRPQLLPADGPAVSSMGASLDVSRLPAIHSEPRSGNCPTVVLGGFVPDATDQVFMLRGFFLKRGGAHYLHYPRTDFCPRHFFARLDDLVEQLATRQAPPVLFAVSFGAGLVIDWLRHRLASGRPPPLGGLVLVSPVTCAADLLDPAETKPSSLLARALQPYLARPDGDPTPDQIRRSRLVFTRMFEAGAQNKSALAALLTTDELRRLRQSILHTIATIEPRGAAARVRAMLNLPSPLENFAPGMPPLAECPTLVLFAENESAVLAPRAPGAFALRHAHRAYLPHSTCETVTHHPGHPVQHASLIFHGDQFLNHLAPFYRRLANRKR